MTTPGKTRERRKRVTAAKRVADGSAPLWAACRMLLAGHEEEFFSRWDKVAGGFKEDDVHDLRVASRRLREGLALFAPCLPPHRTARVDKQVKRVTRMLGDLRNTDEAYLFFSQLGEQEEGGATAELGEFLASLKGERKKAHRRLKRELGRLAPAPLRKQLQALGARPNLFHSAAVDPFTGISSYAKQAVMERAELLGGLLPKAVQEQESEAQHALRIAVKKMRYRLEILAPLIRHGYDDLHGALKGYQEVLGKLHDVDVFREMVRQRLPEGGAREELQQVLARKRGALHACFLEQLKGFPLDAAGKRITEAL